VKSGDTALAGTFSTNRDAYFRESGSYRASSRADAKAPTIPPRPAENSFAHCRAEVGFLWVACPHNGKVFGFLRPRQTPHRDSYTPSVQQELLSPSSPGNASRARHAPVSCVSRNIARPPIRTACFYTQYLRGPAGELAWYTVFFGKFGSPILRGQCSASLTAAGSHLEPARVSKAESFAARAKDYEPDTDPDTRLIEHPGVSFCDFFCVSLRSLASHWLSFGLRSPCPGLKYCVFSACN